MCLELVFLGGVPDGLIFEEGAQFKVNFAFTDSIDQKDNGAAFDPVGVKIIVDHPPAAVRWCFGDGHAQLEGFLIAGDEVCGVWVENEAVSAHFGGDFTAAEVLKKISPERENRRVVVENDRPVGQGACRGRNKDQKWVFDVRRDGNAG